MDMHFFSNAAMHKTFTPHRYKQMLIVIKMIPFHLHFFVTWMQNRASGVQSMMPETLWWHQNELWENSPQCSNPLLKQELVVVARDQKSHLIKSVSCGMFSHNFFFFLLWIMFVNLLRAHEKFSLWRRVFLKHGVGQNIATFASPAFRNFFLS